MDNVSWLSLIWLSHVVQFHIVIGTTLTLRDQEGQEVGSLVVQLLRPSTGANSASHDVGQGPFTHPRFPRFLSRFEMLLLVRLC
jgi:hypothetical protein